MPFWRFLVKIHQAAWDHKFCSKHRRNILRPVFESLGSIFFIFNFIFTFSCLFVTKTVLMVSISEMGNTCIEYRFGYKKAWKYEKKLEMKSIGFKLSESVLRMFLRCLEQNLWSQIAWWIFTKNRQNQAKWHFWPMSTKLQKYLKYVLKTF